MTTNDESTASDPAAESRAPAGAEAQPRPRGLLAGIEHAVYVLLRGPVFILLVLFRRFAGR